MPRKQTPASLVAELLQIVVVQIFGLEIGRRKTVVRHEIGVAHRRQMRTVEVFIDYGGVSPPAGGITVLDLVVQ